MTILNKFICSALLAVAASNPAYAEENDTESSIKTVQKIMQILPSSHSIRELMQSYDNRTGKTGDTIAYIPINRPCLNVIHHGKSSEFCAINGGRENLAESDGAGFYISLNGVMDGLVSFDYNTMWYSSHCSYSVTDKKPECEEPYTN